MPDYLVLWQIHITADNPIEAAKQCLEIQRDPESIATVFQVQEISHLNNPIKYETIDLSNIDILTKEL